MKKIYLIFIILLLIPKISFGEGDKYNYPVYYGTKKCELDNKKIIKGKTKKYPNYHDLEEANYYIYNGNLYKNGEIYKKGVNYLFFEIKGDVIYGIENDNKTDIYINDKNIVSVDGFGSRSSNYDNYINRYDLSVWNDGKNYIFSNGNLIFEDNFYFHKRYFSDNKKVFIDLYKNKFGFRLEKNGKIILENKGDFYINDIAVSNDNINYSLIGYDYLNKKSIFIINGKKFNKNHINKILYSPSGKDLYYVIKIDNNHTFYKNDEEIGKFNKKISDNFSINFIDDDNFYSILTNHEDYAFIKNGKTLISFDSDVQIKLILKKENGDKFVVKRNKKLGKDILIINGKKILEADDIDERFLNNGKGTFSLYPNKLKSDQYYTYVDKNDYHYLFVNGFFIPNMYDYLRLEDGLDNFSFLSMGNGKISCKDITYLYPNLKYKREELETLLLKIKKLDKNKKTILIKKLEKFKKIQKNDSTIEFIKMILDNLNN